MNNAMNRKFTLRESVLLGVLVVVLFVGLYFMLVFYPIRARIAEIDAEREEIALQDSVADIRLQVYNQMQAAIAEINKVPEAERTHMNKSTDSETQQIVAMLETIFAGTKPTITYQPLTQSDEGIVQRVINFSFLVETGPEAHPETAYERGKAILDALTNTGRRSLLSNLSVSPTNGNVATDDLRVTGTITFYELAA